MEIKAVVRIGGLHAKSFNGIVSNSMYHHLTAATPLLPSVAVLQVGRRRMAATVI